jgi:hypothetical protein
MEIDEVFRHLTSIVLPAMGEPDAGRGRCDRCGQEVAEGYTSTGAYRIVGHKNTLFHCQACHSLDVGDVDITGIERQAGTSGKYVPNKFGMMTSTGALIELETGKTVFFAPQKIIDKLPQYFLDRVTVQAVLGQAQLSEVLKAKPPFIYISDFGRKTDELVTNLKTSNSHRCVFACSDNGVTELNLEAASKVDAKLKSVEDKQFTLFTTIVSRLARGQVSPIDAGEQMSEFPALITAFKLLPADPHLRLNLITLLRYMRKA